MTEKKTFDCPSCGGVSTFDPLTVTVEHSEPHCAAWKAKQLESSAVAAAPAVGGTVTRLAPSVVQFTCPECGAPAVMHPREQPISVQHSLPVCKLWEKITGKKDDVERYLIKAGVHIYAPQHELPARESVRDPSAQTDDAGGEQ